MENTGYPCPGCGAPADLASGCPGCNRPPYPPAAEVVRLDREIATLAPEVERARVTYQDLLARLGSARQRRSELAARIRLEIPPPQPVRPVPVPPAPVVVGPGRPETSTRTVQGLLFVLGGLLLGTAAIVFTAVAWAAVGVAGRALILAAVTVLALAVPLVATRRGLRGTAETFAAVGLLLVLLDGYAAWTVDLFGVAGWPGTRYAALVGGIGAAVSAGYARLSRLTVPWFAALLAAQPVLPLAAAAARPSAAGWALVCTGVALGDLVVVVALRPRVSPATSPVRAGVLVGTPAVVAGRVLGWLGHGVALAVAAGCALVPLAWGRAAGTPLLAGGPLLLVALALLGGALAAGGRAYRVVAAGLLVPVLATALLRPVAELRPGLLLVAAGSVAAVLAGAVAALPARLRTGPRVGALVVAGGLAQVATLVTVVLAGGAVLRSLPPWRGAAAGPAPHWGWQLPVAVVLTAAAVALLLPRAARPVVAVVGGALAVLAAPAAAPTPWPVVVAADLLAATALLAFAVLRPRRRSATVLVPTLGGAVLLGHGLLVGLADPGGAGAALAVVVVAGALVAARGRRGAGVQPAVGGVALGAAVLAVPAAVAVGLIAAGAPSWWQLRGAFAAVGVLVVAVLAVRRQWPDLLGYASTGFAAALALVGAAPLVVPGDERVSLYATLGVLAALAVGGGARPGVAPRLVGAGLSGLALLAVAPVTLRVLVDLPVPPWSGVPAVDRVPGAAGTGLTLLLLGAAAAAYARIVRGGRWMPALAGLPFGAVGLPVLLVAAGAPWPTAPAVAFGVGLAALLVAALAVPRPPLPAVTLPVGLAVAAPGLGGLLATRAGTLAGLGALVVAAAVVGAVGRHADTRLAGWLSGVLAAAGFAVTGALAGGLPLRTAAFGVLVVAVLVLFAAPTLAAREAAAGPASQAAAGPASQAATGSAGQGATGPEAATGAGRAGQKATGRGPALGVALEAAAQAVAVLALLLTGGALRHAAAICALWGAAVALRVLRRGEATSRRWVLAGIAGGSELLGGWLLLAAGGVVLLEAYTVPAAGLALAAGLVALRTRAGLNSWLALGPGLAAALLPSLVSVLVAVDPQPWRRLALGVVALGAVLAGAARRWQAPVLLGAATLVPLALHELARGWDLLPRWIYLGLGGLALIALAATYERRRRDLARLRTVVARMS
ncbi:hypothetical protein U2F26_18930 [Micromonospora sp. 4G57]|uniref:Permease n=1 Tax=Micromonospora sicca TaxID=2202420 RepID=A0ABU5JFC2_9ACTN|nr:MULTISPECIES: hypothetical protein [unclassified Micromonospora]MDZ5444794.1 hypothetical protein [Micromonospora sp. 4G57]MDZ5491304.1 hypothetical protein [Micromonospora sp. 4G53]